MTSSVKKIMENFCKQGVDDLHIKKDKEVIIIGYFKEYPVDCVKIKNNKIIYIIFNRQEKLKWIFDLIDNEAFIEYDI